MLNPLGMLRKCNDVDNNEGVYNKTQLKKSKWQYVIPLFYFLYFSKFYFAASNPAMQQAFSIIFGGIGILSTLFFTRKIPQGSLIFPFLLLLSFFSILTALIGPNYRIEDFLLVFAYIGLALLPLFVRLSYSVFTTQNYILLVFFLWCMLTGKDANELFSVSRNFVSQILLIFWSYHVIAANQNDKKPSLIILFTSFIIAIWAVGRSGIIVFFLLLISYFFVVKTKLIYKLLSLLIVFLLGGYIYSNYSDFLYTGALGRLENKGIEDSGREEVVADYYQATISTPLNLLFGADTNTIQSIVDLEGNTHNSFVRLHVYYGFAGFLMVIGFILFAFWYLIKIKCMLYITLLIALLIRSYVDFTAFHGFFDPLIYYFIFYAIKDIYIEKMSIHLKYINH